MYLCIILSEEFFFFSLLLRCIALMHVTETAKTITTAAPPPTPAHSRVDSNTVSVFVCVCVCLCALCVLLCLVVFVCMEWLVTQGRCTQVECITLLCVSLSSWAPVGILLWYYKSTIICHIHPYLDVACSTLCHWLEILVISRMIHSSSQTAAHSLGNSLFHWSWSQETMTDCRQPHC